MGKYGSRLRRWSLASVSAGVLASMVSIAALGAVGGAATSAPSITNFPRQYLGRGVSNTWAASNWSGYAETGTYSGVTGTWKARW